MSDGGGLRCRTVATDSEPDARPGGTTEPTVTTRTADAQLSAFHTPRRQLWGTGVAMRIDVPAPWPDHLGDVTEALERIPTEDSVNTPGTGAVAFGALPFDREAAATLVVPSHVHGRNVEGTRWVTSIKLDDADSAPLAPTSAHPRTDVGKRRAPATTTMRIRAGVDPDRWCAAVAEATERIRSGALTKVVLARRLDIESDVRFDAAELLGRLRETNPSALCFAVDDFVGASPELLVSRIGEIVRAQPMAGTTARTGEPEADQRRAAELLASEKNRTEHQITIDAVHEAVLPWCSYLDAEPSPSVVPAGPVQHLATVVEGRLSRPAPSVLQLVAALHPTPAVGGWPRDRAIELIAELEATDRGRYAGPVGWVDAAGNGAWAVGIRSVQLSGTSASLFAGVGVVADSEPASEFDETRSKAQAMLSTLMRI